MTDGAAPPPGTDDPQMTVLASGERARPVPAGPRTLPDGYPAWARALADLYFSGTTSLFILHGNVHDLLPYEDGGQVAYCNLSSFLANQVFGAWDVVLRYDVGHGLRPMAGRDPERLRKMVEYLTRRLGQSSAWPRTPDKVLPLLDQVLERNLLEDSAARRKSVGLVFDYAQYLAPAGAAPGLGRSHTANLIQLLGWAQNPFYKRVNMAFCLIADRLSELNDRLVQSPHVAAIEVPMPTFEARKRFVHHVTASAARSSSGVDEDQLADLSNGLSLVGLNVVLSKGRPSGQPIDIGRFGRLKKSMIERQCRGLVEFIKPDRTLDLVVGQEAAKRRLREDADLIARGEHEAAPMGYLLCGPVGTGKSFLAECYAGSIGVPCLKLRNFRSKYVGETEGNLEQVLTVLRCLGPVMVIIDEADATLGHRSGGGDSGTSSRVFSMIATQMGDTRYRGRIVWMLLTSRPDLLPIDLKRQGRAEVHIPMFYPRDQAQWRTMIEVMARKNGIPLGPDAIPPLGTDRSLSGADIESIVLAARRRVLTEGRTVIEAADLERSWSQFIPSAQGLEKELQELAAVLECTELDFLPADWRERVAEDDGRAKLQRRFVALRRSIGD